MTPTELTAALAKRDALSRAGQTNTPQFQALQASIMSALDAKSEAATRQTYIKYSIGGGVVGGVVGMLFGGMLKGAIIGAVGVPLTVIGISMVAMRGMQ